MAHTKITKLSRRGRGRRGARHSPRRRGADQWRARSRPAARTAGPISIRCAEPSDCSAG